jgi:methylenetetrahydrofolate reductase (NADPH)
MTQLYNFKQEKINISAEFFPPKTEQGLENLIQVHQQLAVYNPEFFSVTFGAGGGTQERTLKAVETLLKYGIPIAPHLSCIGAQADNLLQLLTTYQKIGVKRIVALRGDIPSGLGSLSRDDPFQHADDLVKFIRQHFGDFFHLDVAAYPEQHPQAKSFNQDITHFVNKVKAGANSAITQYFFNSDAYFHFIESCEKHGLDTEKTPIVPGIMPLTNYEQIARFSQMCGADIPRWLDQRLQDFPQTEEGLNDLKAYGADVIAQLCEQLIGGGVKDLHFYSLNQAKPINDILCRITF